MTWRATLLRAALGGAMLFGGILLSSGTAQARDCRRDIEKEERNLNNNIRRHGYYSRQANHSRHELDEARRACGGYRGYGWLGDRGRDRDRDRDDRWRRDRNRDRDHDGDRDDRRGRDRNRDGRWHNPW